METASLQQTKINVCNTKNLTSKNGPKYVQYKVKHMSKRH